MNNPDFGDLYIRAEDLIHEGKWCETPYVVTAAHAPGTFKAADGKPIDKDILELEPGGFRMIVGATNWRLIRYATGIETKEDIVGQRLILYPAQGNWFGQKQVAAVRVRIPDGNFRPFIKPANLGVDITGKRFTTYQKAMVAAKGIDPQPAVTPPIVNVTPGSRIAGCTTNKELQDLLENWITQRPLSENQESWAGIIGLVKAKVVALGEGESSYWKTFVQIVNTAINPVEANDEAMGETTSVDRGEEPTGSGEAQAEESDYGEV